MMISLLLVSNGPFFKNNKDEIIYDGMIVHSKQNTVAEFRISNIRKDICTYEYRYSKNSNWTVANTNYPLSIAKTVFVLNDPNNKLSK